MLPLPLQSHWAVMDMNMKEPGLVEDPSVPRKGQSYTTLLSAWPRIFRS